MLEKDWRMHILHKQTKSGVKLFLYCSWLLPEHFFELTTVRDDHKNYARSDAIILSASENGPILLAFL